MNRKLFSILSLLCIALGLCAQSMPITKPDLGNASVVVCAQNTYNYFVVNLNAERPKYHDQAGLQAKTQKIVQSFRYIDADIYAMCEIEINDSALAYLTNAMNTAAGQTKYAYIHNNFALDTVNIMSGFMYRTDRVRPIGNLGSPSTQTYYKRTMLIQLWEEIATGERFYLSMNHFKAKDSTTDQGEAKRIKNATDLINNITRFNQDPDYLIMGDFNCTTDETPAQNIISAGYAEQLERLNTSPYSYYYGGQYQLIDHAFANSTMAAQITGAAVYHINTGVRNTANYNSYYYSDHDPVLVGLNLGDGTVPPTPQGCEPVDDNAQFTSGLGEWTTYTVSGSVSPTTNATYGYQVNAYQKTAPVEVWLISPEYDLSGMQSASIALNHNIYFDNGVTGDYTSDQTLWVSTNYTSGDPTQATWTQVTIPNYAVKQYVTATCSVPAACLADGFRYALRYTANSSADANYWEVKSARLTSVCRDDTPVENITIDVDDANTRVYTVMGQEVTAQRSHLPAGIYVLVNGNSSTKLFIR